MHPGLAFVDGVVWFWVGAADVKSHLDWILTIFRDVLDDNLRVVGYYT